MMRRRKVRNFVLCVSMISYVILLIFKCFVVLSTMTNIDEDNVTVQSQAGNAYLLPGTTLKQHLGNRIYNQAHKMALLVPFRNCSEELNQFAPYIETFLNNQKIAHTIYVINQTDAYSFNRATLINVGFLESDPNCDYIAMHDVDLLPLNPLLNYSFPSEGPYHVSSPKLHPKYHYPTFIGGILLITREHFESVNGMSNLFWGWGGEDDEFGLRLLHFGMKVRHPVDVKTGVQDTFRHIHNSKKRPRDQYRYHKQGFTNRPPKDLKTGRNTFRDLHKDRH